jgi:hypothetical protein
MTANRSGPASVATEGKARELDQHGGLIDPESNTATGTAQGDNWRIDKVRP